MRFASLGSGSEGNALLVETRCGAGHARILIDCGFGPREASRRLNALGIEPASLQGILVTHEHSDHIGGVFRLSAQSDIPVYLTHGTLAAADMSGDEALVHVIDSHQSFELPGFRITPVPVPHDAREPVQYVIDDGRARLGVLTDLGHGTAHVHREFSGLDGLVLECNHDERMLAENPRYPPMLKRRIGGPYGHLANSAATQILSALDQSRLRIVVAAHLSQKNNTPELARTALAAGLGAASEDMRVADQANGFSWLEV